MGGNGATTSADTDDSHRREALVRALGGDKLACSTANLLMRHGVMAIGAIADMYRLMGHDETTSRLTDMRQLDPAAIERIQAAATLYTKGEIGDLDTALRLMPIQTSPRDAESLHGRLLRTRNAIRNNAALPSGFLRPGSGLMTPQDLAALLDIVLGDKHR